MNAVGICSEQLVPLYFQDLWETGGRAGCIFMALRYSSMGEEAHLHLLAVEVYRWFVVIHSMSGRRNFIFNTKYGICALDANKIQKLLVITEDPCTLHLSCIFKSFAAGKSFHVISAWHKHGFKVLGYCITWRLLWESKEWKKSRDSSCITLVTSVEMRSHRGWAVVSLRCWRKLSWEFLPWWFCRWISLCKACTFGLLQWEEKEWGEEIVVSSDVRDCIVKASLCKPWFVGYYWILFHWKSNRGCLH